MIIVGRGYDLKWIGFYTARQRKRAYRLLLVCILLLIFGAILGGMGYFVYHRFFAAPKPEKIRFLPDAGLTYLGDIPIYEDFIPEEAAGRILQKREIKYIVIHETGNTSPGADAAAHNSFIHNNSMTVEHSWHYTVDDHEIYHHLPDDEPAYHAGDHLVEDGGNLNGIGVEICIAEDNDYEKTLDHAAQLAAKLLSEYDLTPKAMRMHQDFSGKTCPEIMIEQGGWEDFVALVRQYYEEFSAQPE